jgi:hypothetical protein
MEETCMSKKMQIKKDWEIYRAEQQELDRKLQIHREKKATGEKTRHPRMPNGTSRWDLCNSYANYDQMRWGPDPIDTVIDRMGVFVNADFAEDIEYASQNQTPTTWISRTGTPEYETPGSSHYQITTVKEFAKHGLDAHTHEIFDSAPMGKWCTRISDYIGLEYEKAQEGAKRDHGYALVHAQRPGQVATWHYDTYFNLIKADPDMQYNTNKFRRFAVFLEDWRPGHVWNFGNSMLTHWVKGECITWDWMHMPHGTANMCLQTRYSLHLTGYMSEASWNFLKEGTPDTRYQWNEATQTFDKIHNQLPIIPDGR